jgi:Family of unknown function (DUF6526)
MKEQNYSNHSRLVKGFHGVTAVAITALIAGSFVNLYHSFQQKDNLYSASLICLAGFIMVLLFWYIRSFPLKAQDRAIRAEEGLRYFILTGKPLDSRLRLSQIIALRFASDAEFPSLADRAVTEGMTSSAIKKAIQHWRADYHRV